MAFGLPAVTRGNEPRLAVLAAAAVLAVGCSTGAPTPTTAVPPPTATALASLPGPATTPVAATPAPPAASAVASLPPAPTAAAGGTTFTLLLADGPREGTWEVSAPAGAVAICQYLPDLERWLATWLGPPPLGFIDVRGEEGDAYFLFTFKDEPNELSFRPLGDVTFEADDRGDTATLTFVSDTNEGDYYDSQGNNQGSVEMGRAELTIECGSIFRYT